MIMGASDELDANRVAQRLVERLAGTDFAGVGPLTISLGLALGPEHAMNPRELAACAEAAMMTAKAHGKNRIVLYDEGGSARPDTPATPRDVRSLAHMKMLQSLSGKLNRLVDVREIGREIAEELRSLIDYHNCRIFVVDGEDLVPIAFRGELTAETLALPLEVLRARIGQGITGRCAQLGESLLVGDAANCEYGRRIPGTPIIEESLLAVPLKYAGNVVGVIVVSKLGLDQFDEDDVRLLEVLAGHAAVSVENARLYDAARREAESATALLEFGRELAAAVSMDEIFERVVDLTAGLIGSPRTSVWLEDQSGSIVPRRLHGHAGVERPSGLDMDEARRELLEKEPFVIASDGAPYAVAPLEVDGRLGCIVAALPADEDFGGERELRLLGGLARQANLAIANASNFEGLERSFVSTVEALANALEAND